VDFLVGVRFFLLLDELECFEWWLGGLAIELGSVVRVRVKDER